MKICIEFAQPSYDILLQIHNKSGTKPSVKIKYQSAPLVQVPSLTLTILKVPSLLLAYPFYSHLPPTTSVFCFCVQMFGTHKKQQQQVYNKSSVLLLTPKI